MNKLFTVIMKNLKLLVRSRLSALILFFGPLLLIFLVGSAFDSATYSTFKISVYSESYSNLTLKMIEDLNNGNQFRLTKIDTLAGCINKVKSTDSHMCIVFPRNMQIDNKERQEIIFYVDQSKLNLVYLLRDKLTEKFVSSSEKYSIDLANILVQTIDETNKQIAIQQKLTDEMVATNNALKNSAAGVSTNLNAMDLNFDKSALKLTDMENAKTEIGSGITTLKNNIAADISIISSRLDSIKTIASSTNKSVSINAEVTRIKSNITHMNAILSNSTITSSKIDQLTTMFGQLKTNIDSIDSKLSRSRELRTSITPQLTDINANIDSNLNKLNLLKQSYNLLQSKISAIEVKNASVIVNPFTTKIESVGKDTKHLNYLFPSLIVLIIMFVSITMASTMIMLEKNSPAFFRNYITPTNDKLFTFGIFATSFFVTVLQISIIALISIFYFKSQLMVLSLSLVVALILIISLFILIGMIIGYAFKSEETAMIASISVGTTLLLISNVIFPLETMSTLLRKIAEFNPFVISDFILKQIMMFDSNLKLLYMDIGILISFILLCIGVLLLVQNMNKTHYLSREGKKLVEKHNKVVGKV